MRSIIALLNILFWMCTAQAQVSVSLGEDGKQECYVVKTSCATYYYQKEAGGFSSIVDTKGRDWVGFTTEPMDVYPESSASTYRGLPNLVYGGEENGLGHPGFAKCTSAILDYNQIISSSNDGNWEWIWTFYDNYAEINITKVDPTRKFWFLYEGPIAGKYDPTMNMWGNNVEGLSSKSPDFYTTEGEFAQWQTVFFGNKNDQLTFYISDLKENEEMDVFGFLGNTKEGLSSPDGMVVFGFGRGPSTTPLLAGLRKFLIGFVPVRIDNSAILESINQEIKSYKKQ